MTSQLLERLYLDIRTTDIDSVNETKKSATVLPKVCLLYKLYFLLSMTC